MSVRAFHYLVEVAVEALFDIAFAKVAEEHQSPEGFVLINFILHKKILKELCEVRQQFPVVYRAKDRPALYCIGYPFYCNMLLPDFRVSLFEHVHKQYDLLIRIEIRRSDKP